jgi:Tfp pilus assembly protein PilF
MKNYSKIIIKFSMALFFCACISGCSSGRSQPQEFLVDMPIYEPFLSGKEVVIEAVSFNNCPMPKTQLEKAVKKFGKYIDAEVRVVYKAHVNNEKLSLEKQVELATEQSHNWGDSSILLCFIPSDSKFPARVLGLYDYGLSKERYGHRIIYDIGKFDLAYRKISLASNDSVCYSILLHELCHAIRVPVKKSHLTLVHGRHCTNKCLVNNEHLYGIFPVSDLCRQCVSEIKDATEYVRSTNQNFKNYGYTQRIIETNPADPEAELAAILLDMKASDTKRALSKIDNIIDERPEHILPESNGLSIYTMRGIIYTQTGEYKQAVEDFEKALHITPNNLALFKQYSKILSSCDDAQIRDSAYAIKLATLACEISKWTDAECMDLLGRAYAENKNFDKAVKIARKARITALRKGQKKLAKTILTNIKSYKKK